MTEFNEEFEAWFEVTPVVWNQDYTYNKASLQEAFLAGYRLAAAAQAPPAEAMPVEKITEANRHLYEAEMPTEGRQAYEASKWQPIETALKDTKLWLSSVRARDTHEFIGWWYAPEKTEILSKHEHELFSKHGGWWTYKNNNKPCTYPPTLFQLLPEPPTEEK